MVRGKNEQQDSRDHSNFFLQPRFLHYYMHTHIIYNENTTKKYNTINKYKNLLPIVINSPGKPPSVRQFTFFKVDIDPCICS